MLECLDFVERTGRWYEQMIRLPKARVQALMKLGSGVVRLLDLDGKQWFGKRDSCYLP